MNNLKPGQTYEIKSLHWKESKTIHTCSIYRLTDKQIQERRKNSYTESKKGITFSEKSKRLTGINIYVSNTPEGVVPMEQIHDFTPFAGK